MNTTKAPHVVMLVDNSIEGDSRVQKQARSMKQKGWRVTLVGRTPRGKGPKRRKMAGVPTRFVTVPRLAGAQYQLHRSHLLRSPAAYPSKQHATAKTALAQYKVGHEKTRIDLQKLAGRDAGATRYWSRARMMRARLTQAVTEFRARRTTELRETRRHHSGWPDRLATAWWRFAHGREAWRKLDPHLLDWEMAYGPLIDRLKPDLIHANDHRMLFVAAKAVERAHLAGRDPKLVWDAHEWVTGLEQRSKGDRWHPAQALLESDFAENADAVVTVSETLAEMLRDHYDLPTLPSVVCNAPIMTGVVAPEKNVREVIGLAPDTPLMVYSGGVSPARGVDTIIRGLLHLPGVHFVMVVKIPFQPLVPELLSLADELGVADRVHTAPYVPVDQIVPYLAGADLGIHSILHGPNNEIALATKFYEYAQSRLPIVVSDVKVMSETTRRTGQGEVFRAGDHKDLARAAREILDNPEKYQKAFDDEELMASWTWEAQAEVLHAVYTDVLQGRA
ncbi:glycosyltransferase family 4 protein [Nocardioides sp.]|uniref:glycosyltransferase family 4 protein n=1 Tax=Nocardioides sp. TaxID=35761 RepID=UPI002735A199|nr:glycosyltransferase family 4 protein [Nocardioides sp.]MDP3891210.1 glycosyltransferase family 4 protein [Nocardioides sp.]